MRSVTRLSLRPVLAVMMLAAIVACSTARATEASAYQLAASQQFAQAANPTASTLGTIASPAVVVQVPPTGGTVDSANLATAFLNWVEVAISAPLGGILIWIAMRVLTVIGVKNANDVKAQLTDMAPRAINWAFSQLREAVKGLPPIEVHNQTAELAVEYMRQHGAGIIKSAGLDPQSGDVTEALRAHIETAIADPSVPTAVATIPIVVKPVVVQASPPPAPPRDPMADQR